MDKNRTTVRVAGQEFKLAGVDSEEYMQKLAVFVNKRVDEIQKTYPNLSTNNCVILAALNMADEFQKAKADYEALDSKISELNKLPRRVSVTPVKQYNNTGANVRTPAPV